MLDTTRVIILIYNLIYILDNRKFNKLNQEDFGLLLRIYFFIFIFALGIEAIVSSHILNPDTNYCYDISHFVTFVPSLASHSLFALTSFY